MLGRGGLGGAGFGGNPFDRMAPTEQRRFHHYQPQLPAFPLPGEPVADQRVPSKRHPYLQICVGDNIKISVQLSQGSSYIVRSLLSDSIRLQCVGGSALIRFLWWMAISKLSLEHPKVDLKLVSACSGATALCETSYVFFPTSRCVSANGVSIPQRSLEQLLLDFVDLQATLSLDAEAQAEATPADAMQG